jgi:CBS domain-containing protein
MALQISTIFRVAYSCGVGIISQYTPFFKVGYPLFISEVWKGDKMKTVGDILKSKKSSEVYSIGPKATVLDALTVFAQKMISSLVVKDEDGKVVGIITERDYARKIILQNRTSPKTLVEEIMTPREKLVTVTLDTTVFDCAVLITAKKIRHLPVFEGENLVGLVSISDVMKTKVMEQQNLIEQLSDYITGQH